MSARAPVPVTADFFALDQQRQGLARVGATRRAAVAIPDGQRPHALLTGDTLAAAARGTVIGPTGTGDSPEDAELDRLYTTTDVAVPTISTRLAQTRRFRTEPTVLSRRFGADGRVLENGVVVVPPLRTRTGVHILPVGTDKARRHAETAAAAAPTAGDGMPFVPEHPVVAGIGAVARRAPGAAAPSSPALSIRLPLLVADPTSAAGRRFAAAVGEMRPRRNGTVEITMPTEFRWDTISEEISKPASQQKCGSCWALTASGILSDAFVVAGISATNPDLSATFCLACYKGPGESACEGGNPADLFAEFQKTGCATNRCIDYSWCSQDGSCSGDSSSHLTQARTTTQQLNKLIPQCGCYFGGEHETYYVDRLTYLSMNPDDNNITRVVHSAQDVSATVRHWILQRGVVLGSMHVFANFLGGDFSATDGLFFDDHAYGGADPHQWVGSHAVAVVGWGEQVFRFRGKRRRVPFWWCRNSWRTDWGEGGMFRLPVYPFNRRTVFELALIVNDASSSDLLLAGGFSFVTPDPDIRTRTLAGVDVPHVDINDAMVARLDGNNKRTVRAGR
jgi:hypothetical protein